MKMTNDQTWIDTKREKMMMMSKTLLFLILILMMTGTACSFPNEREMRVRERELLEDYQKAKKMSDDFELRLNRAKEVLTQKRQRYEELRSSLSNLKSVWDNYQKTKKTIADLRAGIHVEMNVEYRSIATGRVRRYRWGQEEEYAEVLENDLRVIERNLNGSLLSLGIDPAVLSFDVGQRTADEEKILSVVQPMWEEASKDFSDATQNYELASIMAEGASTEMQKKQQLWIKINQTIQLGGVVILDERSEGNKITTIIQNESGDTIQYILLTYNFYDSDKILVGNAISSISNVEYHGRAKLEAYTIFVPESALYFRLSKVFIINSNGSSRRIDVQ